MTSYVIALAQYQAARRRMVRAERLLDRLLEHGVDEDRAWQLAGMHLCDVRCIKAYAEMRRAREQLG
jgi:hypothetical protein